MGRDRHTGRARCRLCVGNLIKWPCWPFYTETHRVSSAEILLRTVPNVGGNIVNGKFVTDAAFEPRNNVDEDGLSFYRADFITPGDLCVANSHKAGVYCVFLHAERLLEMSMTLKPSPDELPGHVVIPEITYSAFRSDATKRIVKDYMIHLRLQSARRPLFGPSSPPV